MAGIVLAMLLVGGPALLTQDGFGIDFVNHLWLVWVQQQAISHHLLPTYYVNAPEVGVFYPFFMFYGGSLYAASGALAAAIGGHVTVAFIAVTLMAVGAAYGGLLWLARQLGARSWPAHAPAIVFVTSAYYVTNLYGRGAWPEFIATSMIPLLAASGYRLARSPRIEPWPVFLFILAAVFFTGSHNVTLLLGVLFLGALLIGLRLAVGQRLVISHRRAGAIIALGVIAVAVNAWFLLPDLLHASDTQISKTLVPLSSSDFFDTFWILFNPLRAVPAASTSPGLFVQAPDWFLLWAAVAAVVLWRSLGTRDKRAGLALIVLLAGTLAVIMIEPVWNRLPKTLREVQLPYRLNTYVALLVSGLVLVGVLALQRRPPGRRATALRRGLLGAVTVSTALCVWQLWVPNTHTVLFYANRHDAFVSPHLTPHTWYDNGVYGDASQPVVPASPRRLLPVDPSLISGDRVNLSVIPPAGKEPFITNITAGPYAARLGGGLARDGRTLSGLTVARRVRPGSGPVTLSLAPAGGAVAIGKIISLAAIVLLAALLGSRLAPRGSRRRPG